MRHNFTKLHQLLISSLQNYVRTDRRTDRQTPPKTIHARSIAGARVIKEQHIQEVQLSLVYSSRENGIYGGLRRDLRQAKCGPCHF